MTIRISWHMLALAAVFAAAVVAGILELGPPSSSARTSRGVVTAESGVVQSTVTGTGNIEPSTDVEANFQTSGVLQNLYVKEGDHVVKGQLLATLDPTSAQLTVDQAQEQVTAAQDQLTNAENETVSSSSTAAADEAPAQTTAFVSYRPTQTTQTSTTQTTPSGTGTTPARGSSGSAGSTPGRTGGSSGTAPTTTTNRTGSAGGSGSSGGSGGSGGASSGVSAATKASDIASAQASVDSAEASLKTARNTLDETHLYAPATGTVVSVASISPGDTVSAGSSSSGASGSGSSSTGGSGNSGSGTGATAAGGLGSQSGAGSSSSSSSSSSGLIEIVNTGSMTVTVPFSESDIGQIKVGQSANVTLQALTGVELAGHVSAISTLGTSSNGVVSYNATVTVDQHDSQVKPGMSVSVSVITGQASGVNLPSSAVTGTAGSVSHVNLLKNGQTVSTPVVVGLIGTSRTQIVSGLRAGQQVVVTETLPSLGTSSSSSGTGSTGTLGGGGLAGGGGFGGGGGGGLRRLLGAGGGGFPGGG